MRREPHRARYDRAAVEAVLDSGWLAHVGLAVEGAPTVVPMVYARSGDEVLLHGSVASRLMRQGADGLELCVAVTQVDGLVLARTAFHTSVNYRSVVVRGRARRLTDEAELARAYVAFVEQVAPGRSELVRMPNRSEARQTMVLALGLADAAVKVRTGDPTDEPGDLDLPVWAGVVPMTVVSGAPEPSGDLRGEWPPPSRVVRP